MLDFVVALLSAGRVYSRSRRDNAVDILALRQQVAVPKLHTAAPKAGTALTG